MMMLWYAPHCAQPSFALSSCPYPTSVPLPCCGPLAMRCCCSSCCYCYCCYNMDITERTFSLSLPAALPRSCWGRRRCWGSRAGARSRRTSAPRSCATTTCRSRRALWTHTSPTHRCVSHARRELDVCACNQVGCSCRLGSAARAPWIRSSAR